MVVNKIFEIDNNILHKNRSCLSFSNVLYYVKVAPKYHILEQTFVIKRFRK